MVFYLLSFTAELENLTNLQPRGGCDDPEYVYGFKLKCENCGEVTQKETYVTLSETVSIPNSKGTANLVQKCKLCGRDGTIQMVPKYGEPLTLDASQKEAFAKLMVFECRGFEPIDFIFGDGWVAESTSGTKFDVDLSGGEFAEYDEQGECPVGISNLQAKLKVAKKQERYGKTTFV
ncbi:putative CXXC motif containing zinc binding protein [Dioscorea sansibarensis]